MWVQQGIRFGDKEVPASEWSALGTGGHGAVRGTDRTVGEGVSIHSFGRDWGGVTRVRARTLCG